jgi:hypothetical protein
MKDLSKLTSFLEYRIEEANKKVEKFKTTFNESSHYALVWSQDVFDSVSTLHVFSRILACINETHDNSFTVETIKTHVQDVVSSKARMPDFSTSVTSNLISQYDLKAYALILDYIG